MSQSKFSPHLDTPTYFITFSTYGSRLHGDPRGSYERDRDDGHTHALEADEARRRFEETKLVGSQVILGPAARRVVAETCVEVADFKGWVIHGLNVRTNHVHIVVGSPRAPEFVMNTFKSWATRRLRERAFIARDQKVWTRHGSTQTLWRENDLIDALSYVVDGQGKDLGGTRVGALE